VSMRRGDIRFVNNIGLMHRRDAFEDEANGRRALDGRRHLMRLWLHNAYACWALPPALRLAWERIYGDVERDERWHLLGLDGAGQVFARPSGRMTKTTRRTIHGLAG
jgi:hypothetical protein